MIGSLDVPGDQLKEQPERKARKPRLQLETESSGHVKETLCPENIYLFRDSCRGPGLEKRGGGECAMEDRRG